MGSVRLDGVRFTAYPMDHHPRHVHGFYGEVEVIVDLPQSKKALLASRTDAVKPSNGSRSDARHILAVAVRHFDKLVSLWEKHHGQA